MKPQMTSVATPTCRNLFSEQKRLRAIAAMALFLLGIGLNAVATEPATTQWLRGTGKDLELCLKGEVFDADGQPASDLELAARMKASVSERRLTPSIEGHRFKIWIPVNQPYWYSVSISASSRKSGHVAHIGFNGYQFRQAVLDGVKLKLQPPARRLKVKVVDKGEPVAGAIVKADVGFGVELHATSGANGIATIGLLPRQQLSYLTAWTDDHSIGGFSFHRDPPRDPDADEYVIELSKCRNQKIRFVDENGAPVPGINFVLQIATPPPNYNYIGLKDESRLTTDAKGEAVQRWFPDWEKSHRYADIEPGQWVLDDEEPKTIDGVIVVKVKKSKPRKTVEGRVVAAGTNPGGFFVELRSFQGEREHNSDIQTTFSDTDGRFAVDILPDATYCAFALDAHWVGEIIDLIPYQTEFDKVTAPELSVSEGQPVEVLVTSGPKHNAVSDLTVSFRRNYSYTWREDGKTRHGTGGPQWWATTDESGRANTRTLPGKMTVSVYSPRWRTEKEVEAVSGEPVKINLHREIDEKRTVTGRIVLDPGVTADRSDAHVLMSSLDSNYEDQKTIKCAKDGAFSFDTFASTVGIFAQTGDGRAAGSIQVKNLAAPVELRLWPTLSYEGQIIGRRDEPVAGSKVIAVARILGKSDPETHQHSIFDAKHVETITDAQGNYTLSGLPSETQILIYTTSVDPPYDTVYIDDVRLKPDHARPRKVTRFKKSLTDPPDKTLAERYQSTLRYCVLSGYRPMLIIADDSQGVLDFIDRNYLDDDRNPDLYSFMQIVVTAGKRPLSSSDSAFLKARNLPVPLPYQVVAYALDANGGELAHLELDPRHSEAAGKAAEFIRHEAPAPADAEAKWNAAFADAKRSNRNVWARVSGRHCGPCFLLTRWFDDQHKLLEKDYVFVKFDNFHDKNGGPVAERLTLGKSHGIPFHAIFDSNEKMLIDSAGPSGNIGMPGGDEGKSHLHKMLLQTRQNLTDADIDQLIRSIGD